MRSYEAKRGASEVWNDKLKRLYDKAHGVTEETEAKVMWQRVDGVKSNGCVAYSFIIGFPLNVWTLFV